MFSNERANLMAVDDPTEGLSPELMDQLLQQLQSDEATSQASTLESLDSLQDWMSNHPSLRQMLVVEQFSDVGPALLSFLRLMLGYQPKQPDADDADGDDTDRPQ